ncbi:envelope glycoprotein I [Felid alphaherpesvirus 1]|uniref:Envelope glycoprotein I n=1 Tax=Feline herpesvirus 1 TaxID=10334 RepID=Q66931_FHV1|nr:envelope glycoprotein I [Felid alphaherpesvirus 1]ALJ84168.1 envelope glycoprotein I [Felid alphaherpesvirus 1]ALJ84244.1 envelope glycoprotein I [Felid alphaherpesvirus 1]ALJ84320.1 envelope glycoprotein I [Felid alphaherpesvirus 1]ALJ84396.1 envelope glycoprotein I [Felid alphaherpesvirus 1]
MSSIAFIYILMAIGTVYGIVYRGDHVSLHVDTSSGFVIYPTLENFTIYGHLIFLDDQPLPVNNYNGTLEIIHYNHHSSCYKIVQVIEYSSCPRVRNNAFRSCLHKTSMHQYDQLSINTSVETGMLLTITSPKMEDGGIYALRVRFNHNNKADVFGLSVFVYSFDTRGHRHHADENLNGEILTTPSPMETYVKVNTPIYDHMVTTQTTSNKSMESEPSNTSISCHTFQNDPNEGETLYTHLLNIAGNITYDDMVMDGTTLKPRLIDMGLNLSVTSSFKNETTQKWTPDRKVGFVIVISIAVLLLLAVIGSIINSAIRKHIMVCAGRRIYIPNNDGRPSTEMTRFTRQTKPSNSSSKSLLDVPRSSNSTPTDGVSRSQLTVINEET